MNKLIPDTITIECLVQSLQNITEAKVKHDRERDAYISGGGYSWGYHGHHYVKAVEEAAVDFQQRFDSYIEQRIEAALVKRFGEIDE